jgi:hypothetical protein
VVICGIWQVPGSAPQIADRRPLVEILDRARPKSGKNDDLNRVLPGWRSTLIWIKALHESTD